MNYWFIILLSVLHEDDAKIHKYRLQNKAQQGPNPIKLTKYFL